MISVLDWIFKKLPDTDDPETRRRVVYTMMGCLLFAIVLLILAVGEVLSARNRLDTVTRIETNLCHSQNAGRAQSSIRNARIRDYLVREAAPPAPAIAAAIHDSPPVDCSTGLEINRKKAKR